jgi:hypothetical protein
MDDLSKMFGTTVENISLPAKGRSLSQLPLEKFYNLRHLECPFSESIQLCMKLKRLELHMYNDAPINALEQLGSQLIYLEELVLCGNPPMTEVERLCCSPHMFADLVSLCLVDDFWTRPKRDLPQWINTLKQLAKIHRPLLHITEH